MIYIYWYLKDWLHEVCVESVRVVEVELAHVGEDDLGLVELAVEGVLGQGHHLDKCRYIYNTIYNRNVDIIDNINLLLHVWLVCLSQGLHQTLAHCRLAAGRAALKV